MHVVTALMNLPEGNNLLWALICDMDREENLNIYRLVTMSEEEIEGLEYTPDGAPANAKPTEGNSSVVSRHKFVTLWACTGHKTRQEHLLKISWPSRLKSLSNICPNLSIRRLMVLTTDPPLLHLQANVHHQICWQSSREELNGTQLFLKQSRTSSSGILRKGLLWQWPRHKESRRQLTQSTSLCHQRMPYFMSKRSTCTASY